MIALLVALAVQYSLNDLERQAQRRPSAAAFRQLADAYLQAARFSSASLYFRKAADAYQSLGDPNAAKVLRMQAERYETVIQVYAEQPHKPTNGVLARLEPENGCYVGAMIDREDAIEMTFMADNQVHRDPQFFNLAVGKPQAVFFEYVAYGRPFPSNWVKVLKRSKAAAHIAWEPKSFDSVRDDDYLRNFARSAKDSGVPVFLRFASEMNGDWTPYHSDPAAYRAMFALVARVMHEEAPNVAMVWCPNEIPEDTIPSYYPGEAAVDWVGVNFYSVPFNDADRARGAEWRNPADTLRFVYNRYSRLHPMMIGEWAASHLSVVDNQPRSEFAQNKIAQLYAALPRLYPRVKSVQWLSMNTIKYAMPGRQLNDYSLLSDSSIAKGYGAAIAPAYYLSQVGDSSPVDYAIVGPGKTLPSGTRLSAWVKTYIQRPTVIWSVDGVEVQRSSAPGAYDLVTRQALTKGHRVDLILKTESGSLIDQRTIRL